MSESKFFQDSIMFCISCVKADFSLPAIAWSQSKKFAPPGNFAKLFNPGPSLEIGIEQIKFSQNLLDWRI